MAEVVPIDTTDTSNRFFVGMAGDSLMMMMPPVPQSTISKQEALNLAAWLVALADDHDDFNDFLQSVRNT